MPLSEGWKEAPKLALTRLGAYCSQPLIYNLNGAFNYLHIGWWLRANGFDVPLRVRSRYQLFDLVAAEVGDRDVLYMEFGVHAGVSIRYWSQLLTSPAAKLHGFDSFIGLPHDWTLEGHPRGYFSTEGVVPVVDDPRITFFPGWFEDTVPAYEWPEHDVLVVMLDADLYSSTTTVLGAVRDHLVPGVVPLLRPAASSSRRAARVRRVDRRASGSALPCRRRDTRAVERPLPTN